MLPALPKMYVSALISSSSCSSSILIIEVAVVAMAGSKASCGGRKHERVGCAVASWGRITLGMYNVSLSIVALMGVVVVMEDMEGPKRDRCCTKGAREAVSG